ncbi:MAG: efflux RND transporter periplasmic adaptor subunit [Halieaceae bacterium]|jgi:RND family efflux transporter MFP subunit|nr:efflux RND transporter periplasmic adaptor subunit [Halieaceae bacterium]
MKWTAVLLAFLALGHLSPSVAQERLTAPVRVAAAEEIPVLEELEFAGSVSALRASSLSPATAGLVAELLVDAGDEVEAGDVLLRLDDELARFQVASDESAARRAKQAAADARRRLSEARELVKKQTIAETAVRDLESEVIEDEAEFARASAVAGLSRATLERHTLRAPFSGVISARSTDLGEWVTPGSNVLALVSTEQVTVDLQVSESFLGRIDRGQPLNLSFSSGVVIPAHVAATVPVTDPTARTFLVRARADAAHAAMIPGVSVIARMALDTGRRGVTVPRDAVLRYSDGRSVVWVVETQDGLERSVRRLVQTGLAFDGRIELRSGVSPGERVVVVGNEALRDDQPVRVVRSD